MFVHVCLYTTRLRLCAGVAIEKTLNVKVAAVKDTSCLW